MRTADEPASPQGVAQSYKDIEGNRKLRAVENTGGLTKLEYFAGQAMAALVASNDEGAGDRLDGLPTYAVDIAKALCAELDKRKETKP